MKIVKHIPNTITSMNLLCGVLGVIFTFKGRFDIAFILMLAAAVCDFFDGMSARLLNAYSPLGKELDSLADMVSFGVLPALMMHCLMIVSGICGIWVYIPLSIAVFSALRLAKFNIDERQTENFIGLATPACAMICGSFAYYITKSPESIVASWAKIQWFVPACSLVLSLLLVSEIPMFSMKFKKGGAYDKRYNILRIIFAAIIICSSVIALVFHLNWSIIILIGFISYILINTVNRLT